MEESNSASVEMVIYQIVETPAGAALPFYISSFLDRETHLDAHHLRASTSHVGKVADTTQQSQYGREGWCGALRGDTGCSRFHGPRPADATYASSIHPIGPQLD